MTSPMSPVAPDDKTKDAPGAVQPETGGEKKASGNSENKPANSSTASGDKAAEQAKSGVEFDHGEKSEEHQAHEEAKEKDAKDPWGTTPVQMRGEVDQDPPGTRSTLVDGLNPHLQEFPEGEEISGGTLPPV